MRPLFIGLVAGVLTLIAPALSSAAHAREMRGSYRYSGCVCRFGYGSDNCQPDVACSGEGGRCTRSCSLAPQHDYSTRG